MQHKLAVIGLGNTLRRDDGIGIVILESLLNFYKNENIDYLNFGIASFDLIHRLENYKKVLLVDAINANLEPGELKIFELSKINFNLKDKIISSHELNLKNIFELCKKFKIKTKIYVAGIQIKDVSWEEGLSQELEEKKEKIIQEINKFIAEVFE
ncbi:MAG: hydrogenase maturation protease [Candidatus Omnitrophota bacterium]